MIFSRGIAISILSYVCYGSADVQAIEYDVPEPEYRFPGKGLLTESGDYKGIKFKAYLETKQLLIAENGIYFQGVSRVEGIDGDPHGIIRWRFRARCAAPPRKSGGIPVGLWYWQIKDSAPNFDDREIVDVDVKNDSPPSADRGWYNIWWAVCRNALKSF